MWFPEAPKVADTQRARGSVGMRYEDVAQDGALKIGGMPHAIGMVCFRELWQHTQINVETRPTGIVPILSRMVMQATGGPISVRNAVEVEGAYQVGHTRDELGAVNRVMLGMYAELFGPVGHTHEPQPATAGTRVHIGRVYAEHVFTKPWGKPEERKVLALPLSTGPYVPPQVLPFRDALATLDLPDGANWIEPTLAVDAAPLAFGLTHTDANQHVNSLVYPQLFEDAALRRLLDLNRDTSELLVDHMDIAFRKPCFAGQRMYLWLRCFERAGKLGAVGYLGAKDTDATRAHCMCLLTFRTGQLSRA